jgi:hypothetical protein
MSYQELAEQSAIYAQRIMQLENLLEQSLLTLEGFADTSEDDGYSTLMLRRAILAAIQSK